MTIQHLHFGEGFSAVGADWGERGRSFLDRDAWRTLDPGVYTLPGVENGTVNFKVTALSDGRGIVEPPPQDPTWEPEVIAHGIQRPITRLGPEQPLYPLLDKSRSNSTWYLMGLLRYLPGWAS